MDGTVHFFPCIISKGAVKEVLQGSMSEGVLTDWGWPQSPRAARAPGRSMLQRRLGVENIEPDAGGGCRPRVAGIGVYPAIACLAPNCHRYISPVELPTRNLESLGYVQSLPDTCQKRTSFVQYCYTLKAVLRSMSQSPLLVTL